MQKARQVMPKVASVPKGMVNAGIPRLKYDPTAPYRLDLEVYPAGDLWRRGGKEKVQTTHRYDFFMLVCITQGECVQWVDFQPFACEQGTFLTLRPGQAHNLGSDEDWEGWIVLFRSEFAMPVSAASGDPALVSDRVGLPEKLLLDQDQLRTVSRSIQQMYEDAHLEASLDHVHALLRHQLHALLARLSLLKGRQRPLDEPPVSAASQRFQRFQALVEERFANWHQVADYASHLGYTEKSLGRSLAAATGMTAKGWIAARINLEAKRLLVHTDLPIGAIANRLGFDEATNFTKFFKREVRCSPAEFRRRQRGESPLLHAG
ncbi:AraC family transcriptional regulator [Acidovorax sp. SUPP2539]|uniref:AraC family transcriptional regulator n=1 Tax=Acidovorax sp. SUPP2539 TaxID=2920878 RepID=UPI0023DE48A5|nr:AraC family transcriptional regulator [Acidovorax sp. SUPP2539]GKS90472.1 helix-turn-helix domain-containing protein [Acidovorax sp. SUPP2539]